VLHIGSISPVAHEEQMALFGRVSTGMRKTSQDKFNPSLMD
jgi:hypothetical protein